MAGNEKTTALIPSVGADGGQPPHNSTYQSIPHETCESNPPEENIEEMRERIRRMNDPRYNDVFIPAMQRLSPTYREYHKSLQAANEVFLRHFQQE